MRYTVELQRQKRKTIAITITKDGNVVVKAPLHAPEDLIADFLQEKEDWIISHVEKNRRTYEKVQALDPITDEEVQQLADMAVKAFPERVAYFAQRMGVTYGRITIRLQKTRWGSCSSKGNLNFNCLLMKAPKEVQDYVIIHELCHRKEMNHSPAFWKLVEEQMPEYEKRKQWLYHEGELLLRRRFS